MFGSTPPPQNEKTPFNPQSPYGISKVSAYYTTRYFRQAHGLFAANGILFNHESLDVVKFCNKKNYSFVSKNFIWL